METLNLTTMKHWEVGRPINLEKAMQGTDRFGGHIVSGHVMVLERSCHWKVMRDLGVFV